MTQATEQERPVYDDGAWYWVEKQGWIGDPPTIAPARYKRECDAWYSVEFSGIPTWELKVLEPCEQAARRAQVVPVPHVSYRLLERGEAMQEGDEYINDDTTTWTPIQRGFVKAGAKWGPNWQPMRRPLSVAPQPPEVVIKEYLTTQQPSCNPSMQPLIESREVVSHGQGVTVTRCNLSEAGREALQAKADHIPNTSKMVTVVSPWKDNLTAQLVSGITEVARKHHGTQQLRERIASLVRPVCERIKQLEAGTLLAEISMASSTNVPENLSAGAASESPGTVCTSNEPKSVPEAQPPIARHPMDRGMPTPKVHRNDPQT